MRVVYGKSFTEYRLRKGFAFIPVPIFGATYPASIFRINCQSEMKDWSVGGGYDRPIPRRIAEKSGIERGSFAIEKGATNPHPLNFSEHKSKAFLQMMERYYT